MKSEINTEYASLKVLLENIEYYFEQSTHVLYDKRNVIRVIEYEGHKFAVKAFRVPNIINRFVYRYLRPSKAKRSFEYSLRLGSLITPEPIAYIEKIEFGLLAQSYYISNLFDYDHTIHEVLIDKNLVDRELILREFSEFTYNLHESRILHHDYSHGNILIKKISQVQNSYEFKIIDVNRMEFKPLDIKARLSNFARIKADDGDMSIIIKQYAKLLDQPINKLLDDAKFYRDDFYHKRDLKNKLRGK